MTRIREILKKHDLRETGFRRLTLEAFLAHTEALDLEDLRTALPHDTDRITLYRTLQHFEKNGLIHSIADASGAVKYALCKADCSAHGHHDSHAHFTCSTCHSTWCLDEWHLPVLTDKRIGRITHADLVVRGECAACVS